MLRHSFEQHSPPPPPCAHAVHSANTQTYGGKETEAIFYVDDLPVSKIVGFDMKQYQKQMRPYYTLEFVGMTHYSQRRSYPARCVPAHVIIDFHQFKVGVGGEGLFEEDRSICPIGFVSCLA